MNNSKNNLVPQVPPSEGLGRLVTALLIDDDHNLRQGMKELLSICAPEVKIIGEADSVVTGVEAIKNLNPQVVFLDIQMADGTGFDVLEQIANNNLNSMAQIVFITAHEQYAIKAFRFSALDFLLKPVDPDELKKVIAKIKNVLNKDYDNAHIDLLLENIRKRVDNFKRVALSNSDGIHLVDVSDIIRCESEDNYTKFHIRNSKPILISKTLKEYEELFAEYEFERVHQSHLINLNFLKSLIKKDGGYVRQTEVKFR